MNREHPEYLIEIGWLASHLDHPTLRVLECTTLLHALPDS